MLERRLANDAVQRMDNRGNWSRLTIVSVFLALVPQYPKG